MGSNFIIDTDKVRAATKAIKDDTNELRSQTDTWLGKVDATSKLLPSVAYESSWAVITIIRAFLQRSMDERDRISTVLQEAAKQVDELEQQIEKSFQYSTRNQPHHK